MMKTTSRGFTLIEMTVVLLLIAIVTHLTLRQLGDVRDRKLVAAADRQLGEIRDSVLHVDRDGELAGFLSDMGRLPLATNGTLAELWQKPANVRAYAALTATKDHLFRNAPSDLVQPDVVVGTGWNGPYLQLPIGKTRLLDPWGNPMENPDAAGYARIGLKNGQAVSVAHYGPTALAHGRRTLALLPDAAATNTLTLTVWSRTSEPYEAIRYKWFGPCGSLITGATTRVVYPEPVTFRGLTPGRRVIWYGPERISGITTNACSRLVNIRPGANLIQITLP